MPVAAVALIVIGAGIAGLTAATALQRGGARTLLLERHGVRLRSSDRTFGYVHSCVTCALSDVEIHL